MDNKLLVTERRERAESVVCCLHTAGTFESSIRESKSLAVGSSSNIWIRMDDDDDDIQFETSFSSSSSKVLLFVSSRLLFEAASRIELNCTERSKFLISEAEE